MQLDPKAPSASMRLHLKYHGPAVDEGRMSAIEAGPAIFGLGIALERASELLYGADRKLVVQVNADFEHGSFVVVFDLVQNALELLGSEAAKTILQVLFGSTATGLGVFGIYKRLRKGESLDSRATGGLKENQERGDESPPPLDQESAPGSNFTFNIHAASLQNFHLVVAKDSAVQEGLAEVLAPVEKNPGIDAVSFIADERELQRINRQDIPLLAPPVIGIEDVVTTDFLASVTIGIAVVPFVGKAKWRFIYNGNVFPAQVLDEKWLKDADSIRFGRGDMLQVEAEVRTLRRGSSLENNWKILRVHKHIPCVTQMEFQAQEEELEAED